MDSSLFLKYTHLLSSQGKNKQQLQDLIMVHTGLSIPLESIEISNKELRLYVSSPMKAKLLQKGLHDLLKKEGYMYR